MAKIKKDKTVESIDFNDLRADIRKAIDEKFGSMAKFLTSKEGAKFGGVKIKSYLYGTGPVSFDVIARLSDYFGFGTLERKVIVTRRYEYSLCKEQKDKDKE